MEKIHGPLNVDNFTVGQFLNMTALSKLHKPFEYSVTDGKIYFTVQKEPLKKLVNPADILFFSKLANSFGLEISIEDGKTYVTEADYSVLI